MRHVTVRSCQGRSSSVRQYRLWTRNEDRPQTGQKAAAEIGLAVMTSLAEPSATPSTCKPAGTVGSKGSGNSIAWDLGSYLSNNASTAEFDPASTTSAEEP
jgi:hypothetical protein